LDSKLKSENVGQVFITGLALDFCVFYTAMDAKHLGYDTFVIQDASKGISDEGIALALDEMRQNGVKIINSDEIQSFVNSGLKLKSTNYYYCICTLFLFYFVFLK
jgi:nicotinamidase/pyrazinamidase